MWILGEGTKFRSTIGKRTEKCLPDACITPETRSRHDRSSKSPYECRRHQPLFEGSLQTQDKDKVGSEQDIHPRVRVENRFQASKLASTKGSAWYEARSLCLFDLETLPSFLRMTGPDWTSSSIPVGGDSSHHELSGKHCVFRSAHGVRCGVASPLADY